MRRSGPGTCYERLEQREVDKLEEDIRTNFLKAGQNKIVAPLPFKHQGGPKTYKSFARQSVATRTKTLCVLNSVVTAAKAIGAYESGFRGVLTPDVLVRLLNGPFREMSGMTHWKVCCVLWRVGWEFYRLDLQWLLLGGRRLRAMHRGQPRKIDPELPRLLLDEVRKRIDAVELSKAITVAKAIFMRTTAHMAITATLAARLSEIALMDADQADQIPSGFLIAVDPSHSKVRKAALDMIAGLAATALEDYLKHARPVLLSLDGGAAAAALWITSEGRKAEASGMAGAFRRATRPLAPNGLASGDLRRAVVSEGELTPAEQQRLLKHVIGSKTTLRNYVGRNRSAAI